jgi:transposase
MRLALAAPRPPVTSPGALANDTKSGREGIGRSRGGLTAKIHLAADLRCRPIARLTSCGQHGDSPRFVPLMDAIRIRRRGLGRPRRRPGRAMADKAYSSRANRAWLRQHGIQAVIPVKEDQKKHRRDRGRAGGRPPAFDASWYKKRNTVERCFAKLKQFRAVATRYDKRERIFQGTIDVASISIWLRDPVPRSTGHALRTSGQRMSGRRATGEVGPAFAGGLTKK